MPDGPCWLSTGSCSWTAPPPGCPAIIASTIGCSTAVSAAVGPERPTTTSSHPVRKTSAVVPKDRSPKTLSDKRLTTNDLPPLRQLRLRGRRKRVHLRGRGLSESAQHPELRLLVEDRTARLVLPLSIGTTTIAQQSPPSSMIST